MPTLALKGTETPDPQTIVFQLEPGHADFPLLLSSRLTVIISADSGDTITTTGIGTGPFKLDAFAPEGTTLFSANDDYWRGAPGLAGVEMPAISDNTSDVLPNMVPLGEIFQQQAAAAGINVTLEIAPADSFFSETAVNEAFITTGWLGRPTDEILNLVFRSTSPLNEAKFENEAFDQLLDDARQAQDLAERTELYQTVQQMIASEGGHMIPMHINEATIVSNAVSDFPARSVEHIEWYNISKSE